MKEVDFDDEFIEVECPHCNKKLDVYVRADYEVETTINKKLQATCDWTDSK